ncbi:MAG: hypothetical protein KAI21_04820, partial [Deltaproteobacteria bacterium]|nr:hypothetical protein [Deltaproteobacteria bacterium]
DTAIKWRELLVVEQPPTWLCLFVYFRQEKQGNPCGSTIDTTRLVCYPILMILQLHYLGFT